MIALLPFTFDLNPLIRPQAAEHADGKFLRRIPVGRWGELDDIRGATVFLCPAATDHLNGNVLLVPKGAIWEFAGLHAIVECERKMKPHLDRLDARNEDSHGHNAAVPRGHFRALPQTVSAIRKIR